MNKFFTLIITIGLYGCKATNSNQTKIANPNDYAQTITATELKDLLYIYASDEFEGRDTGQPGQKKAVNFLREKYKKMNLSGGMPDKTYFQNVPLYNQKVSTSSLKYNGKTYENFKTQVVLEAPKSSVLKANEFIYANYGIDDTNYSDYGTIDIKDKVVLIRTGEPKIDGNYITTGTSEDTKWTSYNKGLENKVEVAKKKGAKAILIIAPQLFDKFSNYYKAAYDANKSGRLSLDKNSNRIPILMLNETFGNELTNDLKDKSVSQTISKPIQISIENNSEVKSENVLAFIEGSEKPNEILVVSAHLDHIGMRNGEVFNGADDDGSGTVSVLEIAEAFSKAVNDGFSPKRSILFLHVTGEEKGLYGSRYYTDVDPIYPLENTIANLNIDMIGRTDPKREGERNYVYLIGSDKLSTDLHNLSEEVNTKCCNVELDYTYNDENDPNRFYYRSDHYNFAKNNIPVIFYFNGTHDDYHQSTDTPDKIEYDLLENRARLVFHTAWELANREEKILVDKGN